MNALIRNKIKYIHAIDHNMCNFNWVVKRGKLFEMLQK